MSIVNGSWSQAGGGGMLKDDQDELETRLIVRLHCQHGVIKTHRLILLAPASLMAPGIPAAINESNLTIGPKALKDMLEHFPLARGAASDPQLIWSFGNVEVELRSLESSSDTKGRAQLATELIISAEEFDVYNIFAPITIAFHLREFNATIAYADSMSIAIDLRFTDPAAPLFMDIEGDNSEGLFVISTSQVHGVGTGSSSQNYVAPNTKKREREETPLDIKNKKPIKAVHRVDPCTPSVPPSFGRLPGHTPTTPQAAPSHARPQDMTNNATALGQLQLPQEPLFLPSSSQLSSADEEILRATGLGIENMDAKELAELLDGEGEEVTFDFTAQDPNDHNLLERPGSSDEWQRTESFELECDVAGIPPTQKTEDVKVNDCEFQALFND
ncbi:hypothetical protein C0992_005948 [Termitomyces sp. T32_za158]|nr:hypothetical protein C0992_005948 [Termitomyces sp. T32_za158]